MTWKELAVTKQVLSSRRRISKYRLKIKAFSLKYFYDFMLNSSKSVWKRVRNKVDCQHSKTSQKQNRSKQIYLCIYLWGVGGGGCFVFWLQNMHFLNLFFWQYKICIHFGGVKNTFFRQPTDKMHWQMVRGMNLDQLHFHLVEKLFLHSFYSTTQSPADQMSFLSLLLVYECLWLGKAVFTDYEWMNVKSYTAHKNCHTKPRVFTLNHSTVCVCFVLFNHNNKHSF